MADEASVEIPGGLFSGYDSINGTCKATVVEGTPRSEPASSGSMQVRVCTTAQQVVNALSITGTASASYGAFSASVSASYARSLQLSEMSTVVVVSVVRKTSVERVKSSTLACKPPTGKGIQDFWQENGDVWVSSLTKGMQYWSMFVRNDRTADRHEAIRTTVSASGGMGDLSGEVEASTDWSNTVRDQGSEWTHVQGHIGLPEGAGVALPASGSVQEVLDFASKFQTLDVSNAAVLSFTTQSYADVPGFPDALIKPLKKSRELLSNPTRPTVASVTSSRLALQARRRQIANIREVYEAYGYVDPELKRVDRMVVDDLDTLATAEADLRDDPFATWQLPDLPSLALGVPELTIDLVDLPAVGGGGGYPDYGPDRNRVIERKACLVKMTPRTDKSRRYRISGVLMEYEGLPAEMIGTWRGDYDAEVRLDVNNRVTYLRLWSDGRLVWGLEVYTNTGRRAFGGNNTDVGATEYKLKDNERFIGFDSRKGGELDQLRPLIAAFSPASWGKAS